MLDISLLRACNLLLAPYARKNIPPYAVNLSDSLYRAAIEYTDFVERMLSPLLNGPRALADDYHIFPVPVRARQALIRPTPQRDVTTDSVLAMPATC